MKAQGWSKAGIVRAAQRLTRAGLAVVALCSAMPVMAHAGEGFDRLSAFFKREPAAAPEPHSGPVASQMNWWAVPRSARSAARKLAASKDASVTRCVAFEKDDVISYEIHAAHRLGLFKKDDFVLTSVSEPKSAAETRKKEQSFRYRVAKLRRAGRQASNTNPDPTSGVVYGKSDH
jgi:hypothetical protein